MDGEYFVPEDPPSCAVTCIVIIVVGSVTAIPLLLPILFGNESTFFLYTMIATVIMCIILLPTAWWGAKRTKKWARISVEKREQEKQYTGE